MTTRTRIATGLVLSALLVVALAGPSIAGAVGGAGATATSPGPGEPSVTATATQTAQQGSTTVPTQDQLRTQLRTRIEERLLIRAQVFDRVAERVRLRIGRVDTLADVVEDAGGNVAAVRTKLQAARTDLAEATALELQAMRQFRAVPDSTNRRAAFMLARETATRAALELSRARRQLGEATALLAGVARGLSS